MYISNPVGGTAAGYYHPTFLYESVFNVCGVLLYTTLRRFVKKIYVGDGISFYLIWYGILRFFIESLRTDALPLWNTGLKVAQVISILFIILGLALAVLRRVFKYRLVSCREALLGENATLMLVIPKKEMIGNKVLVFDCDGTVLDTFELIEKGSGNTWKALDKEKNSNDCYGFMPEHALLNLKNRPEIGSYLIINPPQTKNYEYAPYYDGTKLNANVNKDYMFGYEPT
jgi:hypothetical protein